MSLRRRVLLSKGVLMMSPLAKCSGNARTPKNCTLKHCRDRVCYVHQSMSHGSREDKKRRAVIIGGGMAGLSTALALSRNCIPSCDSSTVFDEIVVYEKRNESDAEGGAAISLWSNGWRSLDALGIGDQLRTSSHEKSSDGSFGHDYQRLDRVQLRTQDGTLMKEFELEECSAAGLVDVESRGIRRGLLSKCMKSALEELSHKSDHVTLNYGESVIDIRDKPSTNGRESTVILEGGREITADLVVVADGAKSKLRQKLGLNAPNFAGYAAVRGVATLPSSETCKQIVGSNTICQYFGSGVRFGMYPLSESEIYWFVCFNATEGVRLPDKQAIKQEALRHVDDRWTDAVKKCVQFTEDSALSYGDIIDNWAPPLQLLGRPIAFVGDANHSMTPNLGQGGCCALEDAVEIAKFLKQSGDVSEAISSYQKSRAIRCIPIAIKSYIIGFALQIDNPAICYIRDSFIVPKVFSPKSFLNHTVWECPKLT